MKNKGFTLAEVLITLGIIGIVAALTIPTLIQNINGARYKSKFKKSVSTLSQAARTSLAKYDLDFGGAIDDCNSNYYNSAGLVSSMSDSVDNPEVTRSKCAIFESVLGGATFIATGYATSISGLVEQPARGTWLLSDGTILIFSKYAWYNNDRGEVPCALKPNETLQDRLNRTHDDFFELCLAYIDVNGPNGPNKVVQCSHEDTNYNVNTPCVVENKDITDVYPVVFHDATVEPATNAAVYVLKNAK